MDGLGSQLSPSQPFQPSQVQDAVYIILGSTSTQFPLCGGAEARSEAEEAGGDTDDLAHR